MKINHFPYDTDDIELPAHRRTTFACIHLIAPRDSIPVGAPWSPYPEGERVGVVTWDPCESTFDEVIQDTEWRGEWHEYAPGCWAGDGFLALM